MTLCKPVRRALALPAIVASLVCGSIPAMSQADPTDHRQYGAWRSANIGGGGYVQDLTICPSDTQRMYLTTDVGGLYRSNNAGQTWRMLSGALPADAGSYSPRGLVVSPTDANRVTIAIGAGDSRVKGVFVSRDGGTRWEKTLDAQFNGNGDYRMLGPILIASPADPKTQYAAAIETGFYRSRDEGLTWQPFGPRPIQPTGLYVDASNPKRLWMTAARFKFGATQAAPAIYLSEDEGEHWELIPASPRPPRKILQDPADPKVLFGVFNEPQVQRSTDHGRTWQPFAKGLPPYEKANASSGDGSIGVIAAAGQDIIIGSCAGQFRRLNRDTGAWDLIRRESVDEQNWWGRMGPGRTRHFGMAMGHMGVDPKDPNHWWFTDWYAVYQTYDAGRNWKLTIDGIEMLVFHCVTQDPQTPGAAYVGVADLGFFRTDDGGATYTRTHKGLPDNVKDIRVCPTAPDRMAAVGPATGDWLANQVYLSRDHGQTWAKSPMTGLPPMATNRNDMANARCNTIAMSPADPDHLWLAVSGVPSENNGGVYESTNAGQTWAWRGHGLPTEKNFFHKDIWVSGPELAVSSDGSMVATSNDQKWVYRWNKTASAWACVDVKASPNAVIADAATPGRFYLAGQSGGLLRSDDGGATWQPVLQKNVSAVAVDATNPKRLAAVTHDDVMYTTDAGVTWAGIGADLPYRAGRNVVGFAGKRLIVGTGGAGAFWTEPPQPAPVAALVLPVAAQPLPQAVPITDRRLLWSGRFDRSDDKGYRCDWSNSAVTVRFRGTDLTATLSSNNNNAHWQVAVDGKPTQVIRVEKRGVFRLAENLPDGEHTVMLVQRTEPIFGTTTVHGFSLNAGAELLPAERPAFKLEIVGDSITCGYGNEAANEKEKFNSKTENAYLSYGAIAARAVKADYTCVAWSGRLMWPKNTMPEIYDRTLGAHDKAAKWNFKTWQPDALVINLGTNDIWTSGKKNPDEDGWIRGYQQFIDRVRQNYPNAMIYCAVGPMVTNESSPSGSALTALRKYLNRIVDERNAAGDKRVKFLEFATQRWEDGLGADWHPSVKTHQNMADKLVAQLRADFPKLVAPE